MYRISIKHNFESAHRLSHPDAPLKCQSIHGHSWWVTVTIEGEDLNAEGMLVEFGAFKRVWRGFLDGEVDHHLVVREGDPVVEALRAVLPELRILELPFEPTTERMARWLYERASALLIELTPDDVDRIRVSKVHVQETSVNGAEYEPSSPA